MRAMRMFICVALLVLAWVTGTGCTTTPDPNRLIAEFTPSVEHFNPHGFDTVVWTIDGDNGRHTAYRPPSFAANVVVVSYNGVNYRPTRGENGKWQIWGYNRLYDIGEMLDRPL